MNAIDAENKQARIFVTESESITSKLSLKSVEGGYKIVIIWHAEKMKAECANSLLKLLEEPPAGTVFILVSDTPEQMLETIVSRTQRIEFKRIPIAEIEVSLTGPGYGLDSGNARKIAHFSGGSWLKAVKALRINAESEEFLDYFMQLMRFTYARKLKELKSWSENMAAGGREWQKRFLEYCQRMIRENFICNFHEPELNYMTEREEQFSVRFAPYVNEKNIIGLTNVISDAQPDLGAGDKPMIVLFNKTDAYTWVEKEADDLTPATRENITMEELQRTWMGRLNGECLFVSALKKTGIENMRKTLYDRVKQLHVQKYPYNDFLYPDTEQRSGASWWRTGSA